MMRKWRSILLGFVFVAVYYPVLLIYGNYYKVDDDDDVMGR